MGWRIRDLQGANLPLNGSELLELEQGGNSRQVRLMDLLPGFDNSLSADLASTDLDKGAAIVARSVVCVSSVSELRQAPAGKCVFLEDWHGGWNARAVPTQRGGGVFDWNATESRADNGGTILKLDGVEVGRYVRRINGAPTCPYWFGGMGDGVTDDFSALQGAINWAQENGGSFRLPGADFLSTQPLLQTSRLNFHGEGRGISRIIYTGSASAIVARPPTARESSRFWKWSGFSVIPAVPGTGIYGLYIQLQAGCFLSNFEIEHVEIGDFGNRGLQFDNSVGNMDGYFCGVVRRCWIQNGIRGSNMGDSLNFECNTITGKFCGIEFTGNAGARQMIIRENNITTLGGALAMFGVEQVRVINNQLEHPGYLGGYTGPYGAFVYLSNCYKPTFIGNTINPDNRTPAQIAAGATVAPTNIAIDGSSSRLILDDNDMNKGELLHLVVGSGVTKVLVKNTNVYYGAALAIDDNGTGTVIEAAL